ncbi:hypothetical protein Agub_g5663, partial [Astrephomene gubernaculifera]
MESDSLLVEQLQASTAVQRALAGCFIRPSLDGHSGPKQLIVNCGDHLQLWEVVDGSVELQQNFHLFERVEHIDLVPSSLQLFGPDSTDALLVFTFDGRCTLFRLLSQPQPQQYQQRKPTAIHAVNRPRDLVLTEAACLALPLPNLRAALLPKRLEGVCSSGVAPVARRIAAATGARGVVVAAIHMDLLHVITLHAAPAEGEHPLLLCTAVPIADTPLYGMPPGGDPLELLHRSTHIRALSLLPPHPRRDALQPPLLAVLHKPEGTAGMGLWLDTLSVQLTVKELAGGTAPGARGAAPAAAGGSGSAREMRL